MEHDRTSRPAPARAARAPAPALACVLLIVVGGADAASPREAVERFTALMAGSFSSSAQAARDERYRAVTRHVTPIWPEREDGPWLYAENWSEGADAPHRQRVLNVRRASGGGLAMDSYEPADPAAFHGAWREPARLSALGRDDLVPDPPCEARIARTGPERFEGGTIGQSCRAADDRGAAYRVSRLEVTPDAVIHWDRGFDADGRRVWGPETGGYRFLRRGARACADPVIMVVYGRIEDRAAFGAYARAIGEAGLYPEHGGYYLGITPPLAVFEGELPPGRGAVLARFPCRAAARAFWDSPAYGEIRKLRAGIARFEVILLDELPVPGYVDW